MPDENVGKQFFVFSLFLEPRGELETADPELVQIFEDVLQGIFSCGLFEECNMFLCTPVHADLQVHSR